MHGELRAKARGSSRPGNEFSMTQAILIAGSMATNNHQLAINRSFAANGAEDDREKNIDLG
jgi:hypothetical protein